MTYILSFRRVTQNNNNTNGTLLGNGHSFGQSAPRAFDSLDEAVAAADEITSRYAAKRQAEGDVVKARRVGSLVGKRESGEDVSYLMLVEPDERAASDGWRDEVHQAIISPSL